MAGTVTISPTNALMNCVDYPTKNNKISIGWTSDASGDATANLAADYNSNLSKIKGWIIQIATNPGATAPTDNYDITISDADSVDVCGGRLKDRDTATSELVTFDPPVWVDSELALAVANAGNAKVGAIEIYMVGHYV